jgi:hypothetical protein
MDQNKRHDGRRRPEVPGAHCATRQQRPGHFSVASSPRIVDDAADNTVPGGGIRWHRPRGARMVRAPYFVIEGGDVTAFAEYGAIERHLEPIDVQHGVYRLFDAAGTEIGLSVVEGRVKVGDPIGNDPDLLRQALRTYLAAVGGEWGIDVAHLTQADLAAVVAAFKGRIRGAPGGGQESATR